MKILLALALLSAASSANTKQPPPPVTECNESTVGQACGPAQDDPFWGRNRGVCIADPWSDPAEKKYVCIYGG